MLLASVCLFCCSDIELKTQRCRHVSKKKCSLISGCNIFSDNILRLSKCNRKCTDYCKSFSTVCVPHPSSLKTQLTYLTCIPCLLCTHTHVSVKRNSQNVNTKNQFRRNRFAYFWTTLTSVKCNFTIDSWVLPSHTHILYTHPSASYWTDGYPSVFPPHSWRCATSSVQTGLDHFLDLNCCLSPPVCKCRHLYIFELPTSCLYLLYIDSPSSDD